MFWTANPLSSTHCLFVLHCCPVFHATVNRCMDEYHFLCPCLSFYHILAKTPSFQCSGNGTVLYTWRICQLYHYWYSAPFRIRHGLSVWKPPQLFHFLCDTGMHHALRYLPHRAVLPEANPWKTHPSLWEQTEKENYIPNILGNHIVRSDICLQCSVWELHWIHLTSFAF